MRHYRTFLAAALALIALGPAAAQPQPPAPPTPDVTVVEELIVRAFGGPPWWTVSDGDTDVHILAIPTAYLIGLGWMEPGVGFDPTLLNRRIAGANVVILPPVESDAGAPSFPEIAAFKARLQKTGQPPLEPSLPPDVRARFVALRESIAMPAARYAAMPPGLAGMVLAGDIVQAAASPSSARRGATSAVDIVKAAARRAGVKAAPAKVYRRYANLLTEVRQPGLDCLKATLDQLAAPRRPAAADLEQGRQAIAAWTEGDIGPVLDIVRRNPIRIGGPLVIGRGNERLTIPEAAQNPTCLATMPTQAGYLRTWREDLTDPIARAMDKPGHAVALVGAVGLLSKGGVLDQLRQRGYTVTGPGGAER